LSLSGLNSTGLVFSVKAKTIFSSLTFCKNSIKNSGGKAKFISSPSRTGISISPETVAELSKIKNIIGIKEASGSIEQVCKIISLVEDNFIVLSGDDSLTLPIISVGGKGVVSVAANVAPKDMSDMVKFALNGEIEKARKIHYKLFPLFKVLFIETNPIPVKTALSIMGMIQAEWRLPLTSPSEESYKKIEQTLKKCGVI